MYFDNESSEMSTKEAKRNYFRLLDVGQCSDNDFIRMVLSFSYSPVGEAVIPNPERQSMIFKVCSLYLSLYLPY